MNNIKKIIGEDEYNRLMNMDLFTRCYNLVYILFRDKKDKDGKPYINHLASVSGNMAHLYKIDGVVAGILHDVVEDIDGITFLDLEEFGVPENVIEVLKLVTNDKNVKELSKEEKLRKYNEKIDNIINSNNELAIILKYYDMSNNYNYDSIHNLSPELQEWFKLKYEVNLSKLKTAKEKILSEREIKRKEMRKENDRY